MPNEKLEFIGGEKWDVMDLYRFLHYLNVFYNRLYVLSEYSSTDYKKLTSYLDGSLYYVREGEQLYVDSLVIKSPFNISLAGIGEIMEQMREFYKDILYGNKLDKSRMELEVEEKRFAIIERQQAIREKEIDIIHKETKLVRDQIELLKENGYSRNQLAEIINKVTGPARKMINTAEKNDVQLVENKRD